jgi:hypothetical protein
MARDASIEIPGSRNKGYNLGKLSEEELTRASDIFEKGKIKFVCSIVVIDKILCHDV